MGGKTPGIFWKAPPGRTEQAQEEKARQARVQAKQWHPGGSAGRLGLEGAKIALQPWTWPLVHGPIACEGNFLGYPPCGLRPGVQTYRTGFTTDINELDVIYGGEFRLYKAVKEIIEKYEPPAVFVYQTCVTALTGDDIDAVCKAASAKFGKPVIPVNSPGFAGVKNLGNKLAGEALLDYVIGRSNLTPCDISIIGEYNLSGEWWQTTPWPDAVAVRAPSCISGGGRCRENACSPPARASKTCSKAMINGGAQEWRSVMGFLFEGSFYGIGDVSESLRQIARLLVQQGGASELMDRTEALIAVEEARAWSRLAHYKKRLAGKRVLEKDRRCEVLVSGGGLAGGRHRKGCCKKRTPEVRGSAFWQTRGGEEPHLIDDMKPRRDVFHVERGALPDYLGRLSRIAGRSQFIALKARMPWLDVNQERHHAHAGYEGMITLVSEIDRRSVRPGVGACARTERLVSSRMATSGLLRGRGRSTRSRCAAVGRGDAAGPERCMPVIHGSQLYSFGLVLWCSFRERSLRHAYQVHIWRMESQKRWNRSASDKWEQLRQPSPWEALAQAPEQ
uniref:Molybdenum-iron cofactor biosynthesis subunit n=1 Tax=Herbaspirillum seropedicae TaxID=964 RepID=Q9XDC2_HERSE|nr:molybdenum-iron cofactor biosynthesis subunit [Herbaspirillum seropedicae]